MNDAQQQDSQEAAGDCRIPSPFQKKTCWYALTGVAILVMLCIAAFVIFEVVKLLGFLEPVLLPILIAVSYTHLRAHETSTSDSPSPGLWSRSCSRLWPSWWASAPLSSLP